MKKEIFRLQNGMIRQGKILRGPFFLQFCKGEISGIITDDSFEKEILVNFFSCRNTFESGDFYYNGKRIPFELQSNTIMKLLSQTVAVISRKPRLFESLSLVDNIFIPGYLIKREKHKKTATRLMEFFDIEISLNTKIRELTLLQRLQIEILHAVACHHKLIIISDVNGMLRSKERNKLRQLYERLTQIGYSICQIESLNNIPLNMLDLIQVIEKGKSVGCYSQAEVEYSDIACMVNGTAHHESYDELLKQMSKKLFSGFKGTILELKDICYEHLNKISIKLYKGEIAEINCRTGTDYLEIKHLLTGKVSPIAGQFFYNGQARNISVLERGISKWQIGCVDFSNQDHLLFENLSIIENVCYPLCLRNAHFFMNKNYMKVAEDYIKMVMPDLNLSKRVKNLTQEQVMQLVLCKWILCKPKLLFLFISSAFLKDEPDIIMNRIIVELSKYGIPVLIISEHDRFESEIIESVYIINKGMLINADEDK